ncbi:MAG TPA: zinc-ribbon domain-containing protein, partial [Longimicrobium sp.]
MKVSCPSCQTNYNIDDKRIPPGGAKLKCARCQNTFPIKPGGDAVAAPAAVPLPAPNAPPAADPYAGYNGYEQPAESEATRVVPMPGAAYGDSAAIPLPGATAPSAGYDYAASQPAPDLAYNVSASAAPASEAIPLPGASDPYASGGFPPESEAVPLPGASDGYSDGYAGTSQGFDYAEDPYAAAPQGGAIALPPPPSEEPYAYAAEPQSDGFATANPFDMPQPTTAEVDTFALHAHPPPAEDPYAAAQVDDPFALPQGDVTNLDFSEPAPTAVDMGMDFSEPPPAMPAAPASIPDSLEFDPTSPTRSSGDDLEADLSSPLPPMASPGTADGLEMLSFIDDAAKDSGANKAKAATGRRFHVRRRSGKVFGPFEEGVIVKMLEDGQLLGNEDVSNDADAWTPIGTVPTFATAIQKLMEGPGTPATPAAPAMPTGEPGSKVGQSPATSTANMERLNQLYGGRMAAVAVVDSTSRLELFLNKVKQRLPLVIGATAAVAVLGVGLGFGTTRYGVFGLKKFFPTTVKAGSSEAANVEAAHKALLQDSFQGYKQARTLSESVLASDEYPAVRALWCQS